MRARRIYFDGVGTVTVSKFSNCVVIYLTPTEPSDPNPGFAHETVINLFQTDTKAPELVIEE